ncbi:uncharacterized protein LOC142321884 [Lycorma delicatula]|uniref:uncharacterized protein LOC142321884 n=1 Tax=Lycorma delicatula TaxID=130591 RepID=UPI003F517372
MDSPSVKATPNSRQHISSSVNFTPDSGSQTKKEGITRTLLTPCRRIGLKRKSPSHMTSKFCKDDLSTTQSHFCSKKENNSVTNHPKKILLSTIIDSDVDKETQRVLFNENSVDSENNAFVNDSDGKLSAPFLLFRDQNNLRESEYSHDTYESSEFSQLKKAIKNKPNNITLQTLEALANRIKEKKGKYQHIELSNLYEKKHDLNMLRELTLQWKKGCQEALFEMQSLLNEKGHAISMLQLLSQFQIPHDIINFNEDMDDFE